ncbi:2-succinyl-5-enolpyruvyl-6-hydroxy-3-cyclohexene-1-carboxylic-acid synthase [Homoserinimonas sp. OAct 916]|uniref:2-succinyl-5-enolpyruvyl-6-hydroxy-3- cyclohexene-1-carboxylic-acid synthase n=1 Tax=Homoserinimonas sp. OAct 916 TaxID=2211450 RepID=UPI000DBE9798|nr:2-succinyl-5-enolpyruvyl-6-hydroxy-3-cyclohexene-1-carboxylic-acid synthase [Homoserinimonas sp. OAct 916]
MPEPDKVSSPASRFARSLLTGLVADGVESIVLSPGSRSQALALVAAELERIGAIRLYVRIDERVAGFLAIGLAREARAPVVVITTSGTAVANLHPAVLEAHHSGLPLILLTADRPVEMRGIRSNQTTQQPGIYGPSTRMCDDVPAPEGADGEDAVAMQLAQRAVAAATGMQTGNPGPVQLNLAFREPLSSTVDDLEMWWQAVSLRRPQSQPQVAASAPAVIGRAPGTIVVAGADAGPAAEEFARAGGWPLIAEVSSRARFGPNLVLAYRTLLADETLAGQVQRVIVFGHPTLSREVPQLIGRDGVETIVVAAPGTEKYNPGHRVSRFEEHVVAEDPIADDDARRWLGQWVAAGRSALAAEEQRNGDQAASTMESARAPSLAARAEFAQQELAIMREPVTRRMLADALWRVTWPHDRLLLGASRLIRELDSWVTGKRITVHSNRGLAGIDGTIATGIGIALATEASAGGGTTRVLLGDLAALHDAGALLFGTQERRPAIQVIVGNDNGGTIFDRLEVAGTATPEAMDRVLTTPQHVDLSALAAAYGWGYTRADNRNDLERALTAPITGPNLLEVPLAR